MLEFLTLFWIFFKIGLFTFGGGYAMIPLIQQELVGGGYIDAELLIDFIGISESTPGPIAINMATFIGTNQLGVLGAVATTIGVALPSFIIILLIASLGSKFLQSRGVSLAFLGLKPAVIGLILSVSFVLLIHAVFPNIILDTLQFDFSVFNYRGLIILVIVALTTLFYKKISPVKIIMLSALLGIIIYSII
ncbi:chromate transporter [Peloplasma aerotolerans]|uniref:Chromate transporter n=1 Tax=Peloplasma aerotolerans TaxID=3044389 RepID=A0AAW6U5G1_9MOLU|nr:chromate transporter [Mariniplasma sp. M4Ah]MDI6453218.1 chromate transporter [Mariniplasma sp. M4Ah]